MKRSIVLFCIACCAAVFSYAVPLSASWIEGEVFVNAGSGWKELTPGARVDSSATVRLGFDSYAEFAGGGRKIAISAEGTFKLDALLSSSAAQAQKSSSLVNKMGRMVAGQAPRSTVVAGVRGDFEGAPEKTEWAVDDDDPEALAGEAERLVAAKRYAEAADAFAEASGGSLGDKREEYRYSQAWCLAAAGDAIAAVKVLRPMSARGAFAVPRAILLARLDLDTGAAREAAVLLDEVSRGASLSAEEAELVKELREEARRALAGN